MLVDVLQTEEALKVQQIQNSTGWESVTMMVDLSLEESPDIYFVYTAE